MPVYSYDPGTKESDAIEALRTVMDPEIGLNVVELGLIQEVAIQPDKAHVKMILTTPFCPYGPALLEQIRSKASEAAGVPAEIELGTELWEPSMMEEGAGGDWGLF
jgi:metal-sulfur cluster biosynthetic enzyme